jgi:hypothetical protein
MRKRSAWIAVSLTGALFLGACGSDSAETTETTVAAETPATEAPVEETTPATEPAAVETTAAAETAETTPAETTETTAAGAAAAGGGYVAAGALKGVCPDTVSLQLDWQPEAEHGQAYKLVGPGYKINTEKKSVSGPLVDGTVDTGVVVDVRTGGPAIGFTPVTTQMYSDPSILLGYVATDDAVAQSGGEQTTIAVVAPFQKNPQIIMWDPATYPDVKTIADLKATGAKVRVFGPAGYLSYLTASGTLDPEQIDGSYDGTPANFLADNGKTAQQGFASAEPFFYENILKEWGKPIAYQLIHDAGWTGYAQSFAIRTGDLDKNRDCLKLLVPIIQRAQRDFVKDPVATNKLIAELAKEYNTGWQYSEEQGAASVVVQLKDGIVANGPDGVLGSFDIERVKDIIAKGIPVFKADSKAKPKDDLTPEEIVTNEFVDTSISL